MLANQGQAADKVEALRSTSWAAGTNNGSYIDVSKYEGDLVFVYNVGAVTGSATIKVQDADDTGGTGVADVSGATTAALSSAGATGAIVIPANTARKAVRVVNTVVTGPALASVILVATPKYV